MLKLGRMRSMALLPLYLLVSLACLAADQPYDVSLKASDGISLKATFYPAGRGPAVLLLHQCNRDRTAWRPLAEALVRRGVNVLTLDFRGFGESGGKRFNDLLPDERQTWTTEQAPSDVDVAYQYLLSQKNVDARQIGAGGASCGVNQAMHLAMRHPEVKSLALLSGGTDRAARRAAAAPEYPPILMVAADDDGIVPGVMKFILASAANPKNRIIEYAKGGHGAELFAPHPDIILDIGDWFRSTLAGERLEIRAAKRLEPDDSETRVWKMLDEPGGATRVTEMLREERKTNPTATVISETVVNQIGYERLAESDASGAIEIFKLNVEQFPQSANVYDSLGDAYLAAGQNELAREYARKTLEAIPKDKSLTQERAKAIRESAEQKLKAR